MIIKNFEQLATNPQRKVALEIVEAGLVIAESGGDGGKVVEGMITKAKEWGLGVSVNSEKLHGEAGEIAKNLVNQLVNLGTHSVLMATGRIDVKLLGEGKGGRNQQLVLEVLKLMKEGEEVVGSGLDKLTMSNFVVAALDSDGDDNGQFAGAMGDYETLQKAEAMNFDPGYYAENNDSVSFFEKVGDRIETGKLSYDVGDIVVLLKG